MEVSPSPLLAIDRNRDTVVERIVAQWGAAIGPAGITAEQLRDLLLAMRADQLLAASLAGSLEGLRNVVSASLLAESDLKPSLLRGKSLGDSNQDVVYVPVTPCRLVETRGTFPAVYQTGGAFAPTQVRTYTLQGGNGVCLAQLPASATPTAVQMQVYGYPTTAGSGDIEILPQGAGFGSTATLVYLGNNVVTSASATSLANLANKQISVQVRGGGAHVVIDVVGYFRAPSGGYVSNVTAGAGLSGGGSGGVTVGIAPGGVTATELANQAVTLPKLGSMGCTNGQVLKYNGSAWACAADASGPANAYVQGGNAFGATAVLGTTDNNALDLRVNNARVMRYEPNAISPNVIGGSQVNSAAAGVRGATVAGGGVAANAEPDFAFDAPNVVTDAYGTVGGGFANRAGDNAGTAIDAPFATVAGGWANRASSNSSTVSGGAVNTASGFRSNVAGGEANTASGPYGSVAGGIGNVAAGVASFAGGAYAQATHDGSFAWSDASNPVLFPTTADHEFAVRSTGGARFVTGTDVDGNTTRSVRINPNGELEFGAVTRQHLNLFGATYAMGVQPLTVYFRTGPSVSVNYGGFSWFRDGAHIDDVNNPGAGGVEMMRLALNGTLYVTGGTVGTLSDRGSKQDFAAVDPASVLARVVQLPLAEWSYRNNPSVRHVGPTAQDFRAAFGLGDDDARSIATVDADGIALAAIQGLHLELKKRDAEIAELRRAVEALLARPAP